MAAHLDIDDVCAGHPLAQAELTKLRKLATQRGERMQIIREWMKADQTFYGAWGDFVFDSPEAADWFDDDGAPVDA